MKNFDDFIDLIDADTYQTIQFSAQNAMCINGDQTPGALAYYVALNLLEIYHNWINEDNDQ